MFHVENVPRGTNFKRWKIVCKRAYKIYRIAYYTDILTDNDILNNNGIDNIRFK